MPNLKKGEVVRVDFGATLGSEQSGTRPALVVSPAHINQRSRVILVAPITSRRTEFTYHHEVYIAEGEGGLRGAGKILILHLRSVGEERILGRYGELSLEALQEVERVLHYVCGLK